MKRTFEKFIYVLTMRGDWISDIVGRVWFRWYCPSPLHDDWTARACISAGDCGCNNNPSFKTAEGKAG